MPQEGDAATKAETETSDLCSPYLRIGRDLTAEQLDISTHLRARLARSVRTAVQQSTSGWPRPVPGLAGTVCLVLQFPGLRDGSVA